MLLNLDSWIYAKINAIPAIAGKVVYFYPNTFASLPVVAYSSSQSNSDVDFYDDEADYSDAVVSFDVYVKNSADDYSIAQAIDNVMTGLLFTLQVSSPVPDPEAKTQHRHLEYIRQGMSALDLV